VGGVFKFPAHLFNERETIKTLFREVNGVILKDIESTG
jgi:hypothetical protein